MGGSRHGKGTGAEAATLALATGGEAGDEFHGKTGNSPSEIGLGATPNGEAAVAFADQDAIASTVAKSCVNSVKTGLF